jgi:hypothetical protein
MANHSIGIYVYVCIYVCVCVCVCVDLCIGIYVYICINVCVCVSTFALESYLHEFTCMSAFMCVCMYVCVCVCVNHFIGIYVYVCIPTHSMHACVCVCVCVCTYIHHVHTQSYTQIRDAHTKTRIPAQIYIYDPYLEKTNELGLEQASVMENLHGQVRLEESAWLPG